MKKSQNRSKKKSNTKKKRGTQDNFLRLPEVMKRTGLGRSSIYALIKDNAFPGQIKLSPRTSVWSDHAISDWIEEKKQKSHD